MARKKADVKKAAGKAKKKTASQTTKQVKEVELEFSNTICMAWR